MRQLFLAVLAAVSFPRAAFCQPARDVHVTPIEIVTSFTYDLHRDGTTDLPGGAGALVGIDGNINDHVAVVSELAGSPRMRTALAGGRISTGFYRDGPGGPGRFFAEVLAGKRDGGLAGSGTAIQLGAGSDALIVPRGLSLHLALDYLFIPGSRHNFAGGRVSVGLVAGPHLH